MTTHAIVHVEIPATDIKENARFYAEAFGWKIQVDPQYDYHMFQTEGGPGGGFVSTKMDAEGEAMMGFRYEIGKPLLYIGTDDIEESLAQVEAAGGKVLVRQMEIPGAGWFAHFTDPSGNHMALFKAPQH